MLIGSPLKTPLLIICWQISILLFRMLLTITWKCGEVNLFHFSFRDASCCVSHKTLAVKILYSIFLVWIALLNSSHIFPGVCLYNISELLVPCFITEVVKSEEDGEGDFPKKRSMNWIDIFLFEPEVLISELPIM